MRRVIVVVALVVVSACSSSKGTVEPSSSATPAATTSSASATTLATSTTPSATVASTTTSGATTTLPIELATSSTVNQLVRCETSSTTTGGLCVGITVPLPPDADDIIAAYLAFAKKHIEIQTNPDDPDWDHYLALIVPRARVEARAELEDRFKRGQILNAAGGLAYKPSLSRLRYPDGYIELRDCRTDGTYWADRSSGQPALGEDPNPRNRPFRAALERSGNTWLIVAYQYVEGSCP